MDGMFSVDYAWQNLCYDFPNGAPQRIDSEKDLDNL